MKITENEVSLNCQAKNREEALKLASDALIARGCVASGFLNALVAREKELSTWIGAGVTMPHINRRDSQLVNNSGYHLLQFPDGVSWDRGHVAFLVVVVAAKENEHLAILSGLANLLDDESLVERLSTTTSVSEFVAMIG